MLRARFGSAWLCSLPVLGLSAMLWSHETALLHAPGGEDSPRGEARIGGGEIRVRGDGLAGGLSITIWIAGTDGVLAEAYKSTSESNGSFDVRDSLAGASSLAGRAVEVHGPDGAVLLTGEFPEAAARAEHGTGTSELLPPVGATNSAASGRIKVKAQSGRHSLEIKVRGLQYYGVYSVCVVNPASQAETIGKLTGKGSGNGALKVDTEAGGSLPFGAAGIQELAGFGVKVKTQDGRIELEGEIPALGQSADHPEEAMQEIEFDLARPAGSPDSDIDGDVSIQEEIGEDDKVRVRIKKNGDPDALYTASAYRPHSADAIPFAALIDGAHEVPPVDTTATGTGLFSFNSTTGELAYSIEFSGLSTNEVAAHIHKAPPGADGGVLFPLAAGSPKEGAIVLTVEQAQDLAAGLLYVNIHSEQNDGGEIRGQILPVLPLREEVAKLTTSSKGDAEALHRGRGVFPLGATSLSELGGVVIEVADSQGRVVLSGGVPQVGNPPSPPPPTVLRLKLVVTLSRPEPAMEQDANGKVELEEEGDEHEIQVEVEDIHPGEMYKVELHDGSGNAETLAAAAADSLGNLRQKIVALGSERLPFGATSFRAYDGFTIVVLDSAGAVVLNGVVAIPSGGGAALAPAVDFTMVGEYDAPFLRGDTNRDFTVNLTDAINTLEVLFAGRRSPACQDSMDANDDGGVDITDPILTLVHLFLGSAALPYPGSQIAGFDVTADDLSCRDN